MILLDLMLPGISGEEVLAQIRKQGNTPVIVLTAKDGLDEKSGFLPVGQMITLQNRLRYRRCLPGFRFSSAICSRSRNIKACHIKPGTGP